MAILNGTIQHRRGAEKDFDASKMLPGELAVTTDGSRKVYAAFAPGDVKELASKEEVEKEIESFETVVKEAENSITTKASEQIQSVNSAGEAIKNSINSEGSTQVANVQAAAEEIIADREQITENKKDLGNLSFSVNDTDGGIDITYKK